MTAELLKLRTVATIRNLLIAMVVLIAFAVLLHGASLPATSTDTRDEQLDFVFRWGPLFGALFAALAGALAMTGEFRHGTIRPTLLVTPDRSRVLAAKALAAALAGAVLGALAALTALVVGAVLVDTEIDRHALIVDSVVAGALWGPLGVGLGALVRAQVPLVAGLALWIVLLENLIVGALPEAERFLPGMSNPALVLCAAVALAAGAVGFRRRDL